MKRNIETVNIIDKTANVLFCNISNYDLSGKLCIVSYSLINSYEVEREMPSPTEEPIFETNVVNQMIYNGNWKVPINIIEQWSDNDDIIIESLAAAKGFTIING